MNATIPFATVLCSLALLAIGSRPIETPRQPLRLSNDVHVESFHVPVGKTVVVADNLHLTAATSILIEGTLEVRPRLALDTLWDGPAVWLTAARSIEVTESGRILGARGRDHVARGGRGGTGSNVLLEAPVVWVDGAVVGGDGGASGPGMKGGKGGEVRVRGSYLKRSKRLLLPGERPSSGLFGGNGGPGGAGVLAGESGGEGGDGGDAIGRERDSARQNLTMPRSALSTDSRQYTQSNRVSLGSSLTPRTRTQGAGQGCPGGVNGPDGGDATGGTGHQGAQGTHGTPTFPNAGNGGRGGEGGSAYAGSGREGKEGSDCCNPPMLGGTGGTGGTGGKAVAGSGGTGGDGGIGYAPTGAGGHGGHGGKGGNAYSGDGGDGGPGGKPGGPGGAGGQVQSPVKGEGGGPGQGGHGNPPGNGGNGGNAGSQTEGQSGYTGPTGGDC